MVSQPLGLCPIDQAPMTKGWHFQWVCPFHHLYSKRIFSASCTISLSLSLCLSRLFSGREELVLFLPAAQLQTLGVGSQEVSLLLTRWTRAASSLLVPCAAGLPMQLQQNHPKSLKQ